MSNENLDPSLLGLKPFEKVCPLCGDRFRTKFEAQTYCGYTCKRKAEVRRRVARDPHRRRILVAKDSELPWSGSLVDPSVNELNTWVEALCAMGKAGASPNPVKVSGLFSKEWRPSSNEVTFEQAPAASYWILSYVGVEIQWDLPATPAQESSGEPKSREDVEITD